MARLHNPITFGSISSGTLRSEDLLPCFADELEALAKQNCDRDSHAALVREARAIEDFDSDEASEIVNDLIDALSAYAPEYGYFGTHPGDGADFGFWLCEDWEQLAKDDGVLFVDDLSKVPEGHDGAVCVVNDHGNATLYHHNAAGDLVETWSVV